MEPRYLLGTNICIYIRQKRPDEVLRRFRKLRPGEAALSVITYGELLYGAAKSKQRVAALEQLRELGNLLPPLFLAGDSGGGVCNNSSRTGSEGRADREQRSLDRLPCRSVGVDTDHKQ
jgi:predicted nucleic acid-binding protein